METKTQSLLEWQASARPDHERSEKWYIGAGICCILMIGYGILSSAWALSFIFAMIPALYFILRNQSHKQHTIRIRDIGIEFDEKLLSWGELKEFWILRGSGYHELHIAAKKQMKSDIVVMTGEIDPYRIRDTIGAFLPQVDHRKERLLDAIIRFCKL